MKVEIGQIWYPVNTLGYGHRLGVWFQGCRRRCPGCISPEFQSFGQGNIIEVETILKSISEVTYIDGLTISGGEPFEQPEAMKELIELFTEKYSDDILVFTGYTREELLDMKSETISWILDHIAVLVDGVFDEQLNSGVGLRGSDNQNIIVFKHFERYQNAEVLERKWQCVLLGKHLWMIGIPPQ